MVIMRQPKAPQHQLSLERQELSSRNGNRFLACLSFVTELVGIQLHFPDTNQASASDVAASKLHDSYSQRASKPSFS
jgi:hypothetical protein